MTKEQKQLDEENRYLIELRTKALELAILRCNATPAIASSFLQADYYLRYLEGESGEELNKEIDKRDDFYVPEARAQKAEFIEFLQKKRESAANL